MGARIRLQPSLVNLACMALCKTMKLESDFESQHKIQILPAVR